MTRPLVMPADAVLTVLEPEDVVGEVAPHEPAPAAGISWAVASAMFTLAAALGVVLAGC